jgi:hypothetical protein
MTSYWRVHFYYSKFSWKHFDNHTFRVNGVPRRRITTIARDNPDKLRFLGIFRPLLDDKHIGYTIMVVTILIIICYSLWSFAPSLAFPSPG